LLANNKDRAVAFKNLNIELLNQTQPADAAQEISTGGELLVASIALIILLVTFFAAIINKKMHVIFMKCAYLNAKRVKLCYLRSMFTYVCRV
jgi:hypothetical protein